MAVEEMIKLMEQAEEGIATLLSLPVRLAAALQNVKDDDMLSQEKKRYYLKKKSVKPFISIFPWFVVKYTAKTKKFREHCSSFVVKDFRKALEYFCDVFNSTQVSRIIICFRDLYSFALEHPMIAVVKAHKALTDTTLEPYEISPNMGDAGDVGSNARDAINDDDDDVDVFSLDCNPMGLSADEGGSNDE
jgi:hypothetical protein